MSTYRVLWVMLLSSVWYSCTTTNHDHLVYVGTYTGEGSEGIYAYRFNSTDGYLTPIGLAARTPNPSYFIIDPARKFLYAVQETDSGAICAFAIDHESGALTLIQKVSSRGAAPCHLSFDQTGRYLMVANYVGGNAAIFPVTSNGTLGEPTALVQHTGFSLDPNRQNGPHAHAIVATPDNRYVAVADLGIDKVMVYPFDEKNGTLDTSQFHAITLSPGDGPRHLVYSPEGKEMYVLNELTSTITAFTRDPGSEKTEPIQTVTLLGPDFKGVNTSAEIVLGLAGKYLYASNRGEDSMVSFAIEPDGRLTFASRIGCGGRGPRHFEIDPTGQWLMVANQQSNNLALFILEPGGSLTLKWDREDRNRPVCVRFLAID
ncbi:MAG: lactonase family protein [Cyclobacteriaceae bacterium]|nr:lactonase family protein [Cyclobacteriaceae bacterium]